ncbi:MAG: hypothetical protein JW976_01425 [Syntrophaceae bacterium]|nr:hypothetical protein [Syntrophaceae bacterium]
MRINNRKLIWICGLLFLSIALSGCAGPRLYSINMYYDAEEAVIPAYLKADSKTAGAVISVAEFNDARRMDDQLVIGRVTKSDGTSILVFPKSVQATKVVAYGIGRYLRKAGYRVAENIEQWNLNEENIPQGDSKIIIGGNIEELEIYCRKAFLTNSYVSNIKLNVFFADMANGRILYKTTVENSYSMEHVWFSENILGEQAEIILADAVERLFEDKNTAQKLKEAITQ